MMRIKCIAARASPVLWLVLLVMMAGCKSGGGGDSDKAQQAEQAARAERERWQEEVQRIQQQRDQDRRVFETRKADAESDTSAAVTIWIASSAALLIVMLLLARERRIRNVLHERVRRPADNEKERGP